MHKTGFVNVEGAVNERFHAPQDDARNFALWPKPPRGLAQTKIKSSC